VVTCDSRMITVLAQSTERKGMSHACSVAVDMLVLGVVLLGFPEYSFVVALPPLVLLFATLVFCNRTLYWQGAGIGQSV